MSGAAPGPEAERLLRALELFLEFVETGAGDAEAFLARHAGLRDLLGPMLRGRAALADADAEVDALPPALETDADEN